MPLRNERTSQESARPLLRLLPVVLLATVTFSLLPVVVVWKLRSSGAVTPMAPLVLIGIGVSLALAWVGRLYWETRPRSGDLLFGELMLWGFIRRWRAEQRLVNATELLGEVDGPRHRVRRRLRPQRETRLLEQLARSMESLDPYTRGHSRRVARHAAMIAKKMGLPAARVEEIRAAALVHDVGKIDTPRQILNKPGRLTDHEYEVVKRHPTRGAEMMLERGFNPALATIVAHHHERIDGTGYPDGLKGAEIPVGARIIAVADTFDAITSQRPYRGATAHKKALAILRAEAGSQLDREAVRAFDTLYSGFRPLAIWAVLTNLPERFLYQLLGDLQTSAASAGKVMATTAATAAVAGAVVAGNTAVQASSALPAGVHIGGERVTDTTHPGPADSVPRRNADAEKKAHPLDVSHPAERGSEPGPNGTALDPSNSGGGSSEDGGGSSSRPSQGVGSQTGSDGAKGEGGDGSGSGSSGSGSSGSGSSGSSGSSGNSGNSGSGSGSGGSSGSGSGSSGSGSGSGSSGSGGSGSGSSGQGH